MDQETQKLIVEGLIVYGPELAATAKSLVKAARAVCKIAGMTPAEQEAEWRAAREEGEALDPAKLPDAIEKSTFGLADDPDNNPDPDD